MDLIENFLATYTGHTARAARYDIEAWVEFLAGKDVLKATRQDAERWVATLHAADLSPGTIKRRIAYASGFYTYAESEELIKRSPFAHVKRPKVSNESQTLGLSRGEARRLLAAAQQDSERSHALIMLLLVTALRCNEAASLRIEDIGTENGTTVIRVVGKGGKLRVIPLGGAEAPIRALIMSRRAGYIFSTDRPLSQSTAFRLVRRLAAVAGITDAGKLGVHSLRHTAITAALEAGYAIQDVQDFAGHGDAQMTQRYNRARHNLERSAAKGLGDWFAA
jgi:integrase/recombinase XerD